MKHLLLRACNRLNLNECANSMRIFKIKIEWLRLKFEMADPYEARSGPRGNIQIGDWVLLFATVDSVKAEVRSLPRDADRE
mmetsp:Transcript_30386/g.76146  ORF Transcript_30386/g.76146 Transcript_30386/m.76146 type:complete len:81 (+) Transcript_30386:231-473(+)